MAFKNEFHGQSTAGLSKWLGQSSKADDSVYIIYLDYAKALDSVVHKKL